MTDGHCATDTETVYVGTIGTAICSDTASNAGSAQTPYCTDQIGISSAKSKAKPLVVMTGSLTGSFTVSPTVPLTVVGKAAVITPTAFTDGVTVTSGEIYLRNLTVQGSASTSTGIGISAGVGVTLHMDTCLVKNNPSGGILLNGASFDIKNTTITGNGPNNAGASWGGVYVQSLPAGGSTNLDLVTVQGNVGGGLSCTGGIQGIGVLSTGNTSTTTQISTLCAVTACTTTSTTCGAQSLPQ
jgi:hypothetical protein